MAVSDLVDASASALQDDDLQQFGSMTLCVLTCIYGQYLQQFKVKKIVDPSRFSSNAGQTVSLFRFYVTFVTFIV